MSKERYLDLWFPRSILPFQLKESMFFNRLIDACKFVVTHGCGTVACKGVLCSSGMCTGSRSLLVCFLCLLSTADVVVGSNTMDFKLQESSEGGAYLHLTKCNADVK